MNIPVYKNLTFRENIQSLSICAEDDRSNEGMNCLTIHKNLGDVRVERINTAIIEDVPLEKGIPLKGLLGMLKYPQGIIIVGVKECTLVEVLLGHEIYRLNSVETFCSLSPLLSQSESVHLERFAAILKDYFNNTPGFYFSYTFNLSATLQKQNSIDTTTYPYLFDQTIPKFVWNYSLLNDLNNGIHSHQFFLPLLHGFVEHCNIESNNGTCQFFLISRRSTERAGTRFFKRGVNGEGDVANFVESEHIFITPNDVMSYVQIRGSIPLEWTQEPTLAYSPPIHLHNPPSSHLKFSSLIAHFNRLIYDYQDFIIVSLINTNGKEKKLGDNFSEGVKKYFKQHASNKYLAFDFHKECKNMNWKALDKVIREISNNLDHMNYFHRARNSQTPQLFQTGVIRTNCIDCLDRTNVLQSMISKYILKKQMDSLKAFVPMFPQKMSTDLNNLWADNADFMSIQYSGTPALKTDFTRTGKRTFLGLLSDGYYSLKRYYLNNLADGFRQDKIDLSQKKHPIVYDSTYKNNRSSGYLMYIILILNMISSGFIYKEVFRSDDIFMDRLKIITIWVTVLFIGTLILRRNTHCFISFPQSYYFYKERKRTSY